MATSLKNLSSTNLKVGKAAKKFSIGLVVADWNPEITHSMRDAAIDFLKAQGLKATQITCVPVPGTFELPLAAQWMAEQKKIDAVIAIGCVIQGETRHFDFICSACAQGITEVGLKTNKPIIFGVLTTDNLKQAKERAGGKHGNKGIEAADTALKMLLLKDSSALK
ncbi:MAG: 6,7-dimethyl-8-ribityllumazine synthase [Bacteroidetes bacterium B1(2017)]|nr:MAG: 6,7-dimethyl-8-ribityllumazine synthase [Bacteroidetes bacterium B1(2017)]